LKHRSFMRASPGWGMSYTVHINARTSPFHSRKIEYPERSLRARRHSSFEEVGGGSILRAKATLPMRPISSWRSYCTTGKAQRASAGTGLSAIDVRGFGLQGASSPDAWMGSRCARGGT